MFCFFYPIELWKFISDTYAELIKKYFRICNPALMEIKTKSGIRIPNPEKKNSSDYGVCRVEDILEMLPDNTASISPVTGILYVE